MTKKELSITLRARNAMAAGIRSAGSALRSFGDKLSAIGSRGKYAMAALAAAVVASVREFWKFDAAARPFARFVGGVEKAKEHLRQLGEIGKRGVVPTGDIIEASRSLMQFSDGALGGVADMKALADVSATTGSSIGDVTAGVVGFVRAIAQGRDVDRASKQIQEMGIVSLEAREKLRGMQAAGASTSEMFDVLASEINKFSGGVESDMDTGAAAFGRLKEGARSAMIDIGEGVSSSFIPAMDLLLEKMQDITDSGAIQDWAADFSSSIDSMMPYISKLGDAIGWVWEKIQQGIDATAGFVVALASGASLSDAAAAAGETRRMGMSDREERASIQEQRKIANRAERERKQAEAEAGGFGGKVNADRLKSLLRDEGGAEPGSAKLSGFAENRLSRIREMGHDVEEYGYRFAQDAEKQQERMARAIDEQTGLARRNNELLEETRDLLRENLEQG